MNRGLFFTLGLLFTSSLIFGQSIQNAVLSSGGASATSGSVHMDYTIGEPIVETFSASGHTLTQGFHQTNLSLVAIENEALFPEISIYPNPASTYIHVDIPAGYDLLHISLYDALGRTITERQDVTGLVTMDAEQLATGTYFLRLINKRTNQLKTYKLIKN